MSPARARAPDAPIIASMSTVDADELHRLSTDEYHRLIEAGAFEDFPRIELIDGLLLRMIPRRASTRTPWRGWRNGSCSASIRNASRFASRAR